MVRRGAWLVVAGMVSLGSLAACSSGDGASSQPTIELQPSTTTAGDSPAGDGATTVAPPEVSTSLGADGSPEITSKPFGPRSKEDDAFCKEVIAASDDLSSADALDPASSSYDQDLLVAIRRSTDALSSLVTKAPDNIQPDLAMISKAFETYAKARAAAKGDAETVANDPAVVAAAEGLATPELEQANVNLDGWTTANCPQLNTTTTSG